MACVFSVGQATGTSSAGRRDRGWTFLRFSCPGGRCCFEPACRPGRRHPSCSLFLRCKSPRTGLVLHRVSLQVYFQPTDITGLQALAAAVSTPGNPSYHHFLTVPQFAAEFGPSQAEVSALDEYLRARGMSVGALSRNRLAQDVTGTAGQYKEAFGTTLMELRTPTGSDVVGSTTAPRLPAGLAGARFVRRWARPLGHAVRQPGPVPAGWCRYVSGAYV